MFSFSISVISRFSPIIKLNLLSICVFSYSLSSLSSFFVSFSPACILSYIFWISYFFWVAMVFLRFPGYLLKNLRFGLYCHFILSGQKYFSVLAHLISSIDV